MDSIRPFRHDDVEHPRRHRRVFGRFALWFADAQGTPTFVAILTVLIITELLWNQVIASAIGAPSLDFDPSTWLLNLALSLLASYASSLSVMGAKVQSAQLEERLATQEQMSVEHAAALAANTVLTVEVRTLTAEVRQLVKGRPQ